MFPKLSTYSRVATDRRRPRAPARAGRGATRPSGSTGGPSSSSGTPRARCAAAGLKRSRPWNVREIDSSAYAGFASSCAAAIPARLAAGRSRPLSGPDVVPVLRVAERERAPRPADAGIDDREVDADRHEPDRVREHERALQHGLRRDPVRDVDDLRVRRDALHDAVTRADEVVLEPEVAQERDEHARSVTRARARAASGGAPRTRAERSDAGRLAAISPQARRPRGRMRTKAVGAWSGNGRPTSGSRHHGSAPHVDGASGTGAA